MSKVAKDAGIILGLAAFAVAAAPLLGPGGAAFAASAAHAVGLATATSLATALSATAACDCLPASLA